MITLTLKECKERRKVPFHFCKPLRLANRSGAKTMTRRIILDAPEKSVKLRLSDRDRGFLQSFLGDLEGLPECDPRGWKPVIGSNGCESVVTPKAQPGDLIYCHEQIEFLEFKPLRKEWFIQYHDDGLCRHVSIPERVKAPQKPGRWGGRTLPWEWARDFYQVHAVKAERLQDITALEALQEGTPATWGDWFGNAPKWALDSIQTADNGSQSYVWDNRTSVQNFSLLWDSLNAKRGFPWESNPWVFAYSYEPVKVVAA